MTIHSDWSRLLHEECPEAFHLQIPDGVRFDVGVIDGHLQLMCLHAGFGTWEGFLYALFVRPIQRLFAAGCPTVVLCFDAYDFVPAYKSMTQLKRVARAAAATDFAPGQDLPETIPDDAMSYLLNRNFKLSIVKLALDNVPRLLQRTLAADPRRRLLIDYKTVVEYAAETQLVPRRIDDLAPLGESDIKYARYVERYGSALVHAVDGDYLAIALLYYAACGVRDDNRIFLFRQLSLLGGGQALPDSSSSSDDDDDKHSGDTTTDEAEEPPKVAPPKKKKRKRNPKCWVDMQLLYGVVGTAVKQAATGLPLDPRTGAEFTMADAVHAAVALMLCAGTDFSRPLPQLGPKRLWEHLPAIAPYLVQSAPLGAPPNAELFGCAVVGRVYRKVFEKHVRPLLMRDSAPSLEAVLTHLRERSQLAPSTRARLPTPEQIDVTLRNIAWVISYWMALNSRVPTPLDGENGFVQCPTTRRITFTDLLDSLPPPGAAVVPPPPPPPKAAPSAAPGPKKAADGKSRKRALSPSSSAPSAPKAPTAKAAAKAATDEKKRVEKDHAEMRSRFAFTPAAPLLLRAWRCHG